MIGVEECEDAAEEGGDRVGPRVAQVAEDHEVEESEEEQVEQIYVRESIVYRLPAHLR